MPMRQKLGKFQNTSRKQRKWGSDDQNWMWKSIIS